MANLRNFQFLRNSTLYASLAVAKEALTSQASNTLDGSAILGRYYVGSEVRTIMGLVHNGTVSFLLNEKEITSALEGLDYSGITTSNAAVVTNVTEEDGKISATSANVGNLKLTDYSKGSDSGNVAATDSLNEAIAKLENQIDAEEAAREAALAALDSTSVSGADKVVIDVTQADGQISATSANISGVKLAGYEEAAAVADVASTDTLGQALGKLQKTIHEMDKDASAADGQVVTTVSEADGVVSETKANVKDLQLGGYSKTSATGAIASTDTINTALSKIENQIGANTVTAKDKSIVVDTTGSTTEVGLNIRAGERVLKLDTDAASGGVYTDLNVVKITNDLPAEIKERYELRDSDNVKIGDSIDIPKDSHIVSINYLTTGDHAQNLEYVYIDASGNTQTTYVPMDDLILETEFASGITSTDGIAHGVVDPTSETFLTVGANGFKLSGVNNAISAAVETLDATVSGETADGKVNVKVTEVDGVITAVDVIGTDIASASALTQEISDREAGDTALSNRLGESVTSSNTAAAQLAALSGTSNDGSGVTSVWGAKKYADEILAEHLDSLDSDESGSSTHVSVRVEEESGVITAVTVTESNIANADDLSTLSGKTFTEIASANDSITFSTAATADGTVKIDAQTDASKISGLTAVASVANEISGVSESDSVQTGIKNLYASLAAEIAARKAAISSTTISGSNAINVARSDSGDTVSLILDDSTNGTGSENTNGVNALTITNDGLFLSTNWDCGTFNDEQP